jgi:hypothetical protein
MPAVPNPVMDVVLTAVCMMLLVFSLKVMPTARAVAPSGSIDRGIKEAAEREIRERADAVRRQYSDRLIALPPLGGWVVLAVDVSPSIAIDQLRPAEASVVAALVLNHKDITHLRVTVFGGEVREVTGWVELDARNTLPADKQDEIARWLREKLGASAEAAAELSKGHRPILLAELLHQMGQDNSGTNLVGAISDAVKIADGHAPATAIVLTDGVHTHSGPDGKAPAPDDIPAVSKLLDAALAASSGRDGRPASTVHAIAFLGEPAWTGKRKDDEKAQPQAEAVVGMLRGLTSRFGGTVLALPCEPSTWAGAEGLHELVRGRSPIPIRAGAGPGASSEPGKPATPAAAPTEANVLKWLFYGH